MKRLIGILLLFLLSFAAEATHNRAGEITYRHVSGLVYEITVTIFADPNSPAIGRKEIEVDWGDNTGTDSLFVASETIIVPGFVQKRVWVSNHTYPGPGDYTISVTDPNRNAGVDNINNSSAVPFYVKSLLRIFPISGIYNNSPVLLNDPIDDACLGQTFIHNVGAVDSDGDSLAYAISPSFGLQGTLAPGYEFPPASNRIFVDPISGDLRWENPSQLGVYNIAIEVSEYRNGVLVGRVLRDIQVVVYAGCDNIPPRISVDRELCVIAGSSINLPIRAFDQNINDDVTLSITGEIFATSFPNQANQIINSASNPTSGSVLWNTICDNVREQPYGISIKATDNGTDRGSTDLATFENSDIRVIGPPVSNFLAQNDKRNIRLSWDNYTCTNAVGYKIYRRVNFAGYTPDSCQKGVPESTGYQLIREINTLNQTTFIDNNDGLGLVPGRIYCYLITAVFPDGDESYASAETCSEVKMYIPVMTKVDVDTTDALNGRIDIAWFPPDSLDATAFPPPYRYIVYQINQDDSGQLVDSTNGLYDTLYSVERLNTEDEFYSYKVDLFSYGNGKSLVGSSPISQSIFLTTSGQDNRIKLKWSNNTSWENDSFIVYRKAMGEPDYIERARIDKGEYVDSNLTNGLQYCYFVESIGRYRLSSIDFQLLNRSQISCTSPEDLTVPCSPLFQVTGDCKNDQLTLTWDNPNLTCPENSDVVGYKIFRSATLEGEMEVLDSVQNPNTLTYTNTLKSVAGCYLVRAIDSSGNYSLATERKCVEYCPIYELPNVFTPNGDGSNDIYVPLEFPKFRYVDSVDFKVFNRWGELVFETTQPELNWTGEHRESKELVSDGLYYFRCIVYEQSIEGTESRVIRGTITILDSRKKAVE